MVTQSADAFLGASGGSHLALSNQSECIVFPRSFPFPSEEGSQANTGFTHRGWRFCQPTKNEDSYRPLVTRGCFIRSSSAVLGLGGIWGSLHLTPHIIIFTIKLFDPSALFGKLGPRILMVLLYPHSRCDTALLPWPSWCNNGQWWQEGRFHSPTRGLWGQLRDSLIPLSPLPSPYQLKFCCCSSVLSPHSWKCVWLCVWTHNTGSSEI